jgi:hypothetical protein
MKTFNEFINIITEDVDVATIKRMTDDQFQELLKRSTAARRNQLTAMRQSASVRLKPQLQPRVAPTIPTRPPVTNTTRPSLLRRAANQFDPSKATTRRGSFGRMGNRLGATMAADFAADELISRIPDQKTREGAKAVKDLGTSGAILYSNPILATAGLQGSTRKDATLQYGDSGYTFSKNFSGKETDQPENDDLDKYTDRFLRTGGTDAKPTYNDPKQKITAYNPELAKQLRQDPRYTPKMIKNPKSNPLNPFNQYYIKNPNYNSTEQDKLRDEYGSSLRIGAARQNGQIIPVRWGSVAGEKRVGTPQDVAAVKARQRAGQQGAYGSRQGVAVVGTGGRTTVNRQDNTITSGGRTAKLPSTKILSGGRVGDLAYKDGKPVYLARADMAQRGNQGLFARLSRATGIGGQREKDAAALRREREQALQNTLRYRQQIGAGGGSISAK